jgi:hypothetical protein
VVVSTDALSANPTFLSNVGGPPGDPVHRGNCGPGRCGNMFDFLEVTVSPLDGSIWASATDTCTSSNDCNVDPELSSTDGEGVAIRQVSGPKLVGEGYFGNGPAPAQPPAPQLPATPSAPSAKKVALACNREGSRTRPVRCRVRLRGAPGGTAVSLRLFRGEVLVASGTAKLKRGRGVTHLRGVRRGRLAKGRYTALLTVSLRGTSPSRADRRVRLGN